MSDETEEEKVETETVTTGEAKRDNPARLAAVANVEVPPQLLDERQRRIGQKRKPAGPPTGPGLLADVPDGPPDVPPTDCDDSQSE
jgi:hypothetical protein